MRGSEVRVGGEGRRENERWRREKGKESTRVIRRGRKRGEGESE